MKSVVMQGRLGGFYLSTDKGVKVLKAASLAEAFKESLRLDPQTDTTIWIDKDNQTQPVLFGIKEGN